MVHTTSVIKRAILLRRKYTGEDHRLAKKIIVDLKGAQRVIPDAVNVHQRMLETALLLAVRDAQPPLSSVLDGSYNGHQVFRRVSPRPDGLEIDLHEDVVARFISALSPSEKPSDSMYGVPGLRVIPTTRHLRIHLLDEGGRLTDACVTLRNVTSRTWERTWQETRLAEREDGSVDLLLRRSPQLSSGERDYFDLHWRRCGPIALGSAMLRRAGLLVDAFGVDVWTGNGGDYLHVEIDDGPSVYDVVHALQHPLAGIAGSQFRVDTRIGPLHEDIAYARIIDTDPTASTFTGESKPWRSLPALVLRALPSPTEMRRSASTVPVASTARKG